ncbi:MAG: hypothetical protein ABJC66_12535 [Gammaproteobacteria bacterium]
MLTVNPRTPSPLALALLAFIIIFGYRSPDARAQIVPAIVPPSSGVNWPLDPSAVQAAAAADVAQSEKEVASLIASQASGFDPDSPRDRLDQEVSGAALVYERIVKPRLENNAALGCHESQLGLMAWFSYWQSLQFFGIDDNPDIFPMLDGVHRKNQHDLPDRVFETLVGLCANEAYEQCVATGDFPVIFEKLLGLQHVWEYLLGREMKPGWVDAFIRYGKLCGQWTLSVKTEFKNAGQQSADDQTCCGIFGKMHRDIPLRWEPNGSGLGNIYNSTIVGEADVTVDQLDFSGICNPTHTAPVQTERAKGKLTGLVFKHSMDSSNKALVTPSHVWLEIQFGEVDTTYTVHCRPAPDAGPFPQRADEWEVAPWILLDGDAVSVEEPEIRGVLIADNRAFKSDVPSLWKFSSHPFRADLDIHPPPHVTSVESDDVRMVLRLTHTPH